VDFGRPAPRISQDRPHSLHDRFPGNSLPRASPLGEYPDQIVFPALFTSMEFVGNHVGSSSRVWFLSYTGCYTGTSSGIIGLFPYLNREEPYFQYAGGAAIKRPPGGDCLPVRNGSWISVPLRLFRFFKKIHTSRAVGSLSPLGTKAWLSGNRSAAGAKQRSFPKNTRSRRSHSFSLFLEIFGLKLSPKQIFWRRNR
jgi:hypothetical protein